MQQPYYVLSDLNKINEIIIAVGGSLLRVYLVLTQGSPPQNDGTEYENLLR